MRRISIGKNFLTLGFVILLLASNLGYAKTYYVDQNNTSASDKNPGTAVTLNPHIDHPAVKSRGPEEIVNGQFTPIVILDGPDMRGQDDISRAIVTGDDLHRRAIILLVVSGIGIIMEQRYRDQNQHQGQQDPADQPSPGRQQAASEDESIGRQDHGDIPHIKGNLRQEENRQAGPGAAMTSAPATLRKLARLLGVGDA